MPEAVIVDAVRTPIGRAVKGSLKSVRADDLAAIPLKALLERNPQVEQTSIGDVMMGCGYGEGESGYNIGRIALLLAGIDHRVPGCTVNRFCASSLQTIRMAFHAIKAGEGDTYLAAGVEAVSRVGRGSQFEFNHAVDGSEGSLCNVYIPMGMTAENVAEERKVSREAQDEWALISQTRAVAVTGVGALRRRRSFRSRCPRTKTSTGRATRSTCPRRCSPRTTVRVRVRRWRSSHRCRPCSRRAGL